MSAASSATRPQRAGSLGGGGGGYAYASDAPDGYRPPSSRLARASGAAYMHSRSRRHSHRPPSANDRRARGSVVGGLPRQPAAPPALSITLAKDIAAAELASRNEVVEEEAGARVGLLSAICAAVLEERVALLVTTCGDAHRYSREFFEADEARERATLMAYHTTTIKYLRSIIPPAVVAAKIADATADERDRRRALWYLEQRTLQDVCEVFNVEFNYGVPRRKGSAVAGARQEGAVLFLPTLVEWPEGMYDADEGDVSSANGLSSAAETVAGTSHHAAQNPRHARLLEAAGAYQSMAKGGLHRFPAMVVLAGDTAEGETEGKCGTSGAVVASRPAGPPPARPTSSSAAKKGRDGVRLSAGCPFVHKKDCPFDRCEWVDGASLVREHIGGCYPPLAPSAAPTAQEGGSEGAAASSGGEVALSGAYEALLAHREGVARGMHPLTFSIAGDAVTKRPVSAAAYIHSHRAAAAAAAGPHGVSPRAAMAARLAYENRHLPPHMHPSPAAGGR